MRTRELTKKAEARSWLDPTVLQPELQGEAVSTDPRWQQGPEHTHRGCTAPVTRAPVDAVPSRCRESATPSWAAFSFSCSWMEAVSTEP